jgi:membrane-associated protein
VAVVAGDNVNYFVGSRLGRRVFRPDARILKTEYLHRTEAFYEKYGGRAVILARFVPIVRTYAPFVAGASKMHYPRFLAFSVTGALLWLSIFLFGGFFFGNVPVVKNNFGIVILAIIFISVLPAVFEVVRNRRAERTA